MAIGRCSLRSASRSTPQMHHGMYIMGCIWQPFCILQEKAGISCCFCIIRVINSQLAWYSHVRCNPLNTPKTLPHDNYKFQLWGLIFVICHIVVKVGLGRSPDRCTPTHPQMHHEINIMECIWQPFLILQERVGNSVYFWIMRVVNSQLALYSHVICNPFDTPPEHTPNDNKRYHLWQVIFAMNTSTQNLADEHTLADGPPQWIEHRCLEYCYTKLSRWTSFGQWTLWVIENRCLEHCYTKPGRWIYFGQWNPHPTCQLSIDVLNTATPNLADGPPR